VAAASVHGSCGGHHGDGRDPERRVRSPPLDIGSPGARLVEPGGRSSKAADWQGGILCIHLLAERNTETVHQSPQGKSLTFTVEANWAARPHAGASSAHSLAPPVDPGHGSQLGAVLWSSIVRTLRMVPPPSQHRHVAKARQDRLATDRSRIRGDIRRSSSAEPGPPGGQRRLSRRWSRRGC
jgi:hypothetical protein